MLEMKYLIEIIYNEVYDNDLIIAYYYLSCLILNDMFIKLTLSSFFTVNNLKINFL